MTNAPWHHVLIQGEATNAPWHHVRIQVDIYEDGMGPDLADAVFQEIRELLRTRRLEHEIRCQTIVTQQFRDTL